MILWLAECIFELMLSLIFHFQRGRICIWGTRNCCFLLISYLLLNYLRLWRNWYILLYLNPSQRIISLLLFSWSLSDQLYYLKFVLKGSWWQKSLIIWANSRVSVIRSRQSYILIVQRKDLLNCWYIDHLRWWEMAWREH